MKWKDVPGWEGSYQVSDTGLVKSLDRTVVRRNGSPMPIKGKLRSAPVGKRGYPVVSLNRVGRKLSLRPVHALVTEAFLGAKPSGQEVCHWNGDKTDNRISNLRYGSASENQKDRVRHGTSNRGERCGSAKVDRKIVAKIRLMHESGMTHRVIAERVGLSRRHVGDIVNRRRWGWLND